MKLINVPCAEVFDRQVIRMGHGPKTSTSIWKLWNRAFVWADVWTKICRLHAVSQWVQSEFAKWHLYYTKVNMICFYFYFWVTMNHWMWLEVSESQKLLLAHGGLYYKEVNVYLSWWQQVGSVSWSVHFKRTMTWAISIIILYRSLNDQENSHDLRCLIATSVKKSRFASRASYRHSSAFPALSINCCRTRAW